MNFEKLMQKKITRKQFLKSLGFILVAIIFFPRKALSFLDDTTKQDIIQELKETEKEKIQQNIYLNGVKVMEVIEE
jgi:hypothetical protein